MYVEMEFPKVEISRERYTVHFDASEEKGHIPSYPFIV
jgi:hypothetical protein